MRHEEIYQYGVEDAKKVQAELAQGISWEDASGFPPERVMHIRDLWKKDSGDFAEDYVAYWEGYLSVWD